MLSQSWTGKRYRLIRLVTISVWMFLAAMSCNAAFGQIVPPTVLVATLLEHERAATEHRGLYMYLSKERSERTGGHEWIEKVV